MKVYNLRCEHEHRFEGWFSSEEDFCAQSDKGLIACPVCANRAVTRLPSAPRLNLSGAQEPSPSSVEQAQAEVQAQVAAAIRHIVANTEDVGEQFADEARRIHYKETPDRAIRGVATPDECVALVDEGIEIAALPLPVPPKRSMH